jgi:hypothetical protein
MAIKENRTYLITFDVGETVNTYRIGFDGDNNGSLRDAADGYGNGPVRIINLQDEYGEEIVFGTSASTGPDEPDSCPACVDISGLTVSFSPTNPSREVFNPDGTVEFTGAAFIRHKTRGFTYMVRVSYQSGKFDLWKWDGDNDNPNPPVVTNCTASPIRYCGWTEVK